MAKKQEVKPRQQGTKVKAPITTTASKEVKKTRSTAVPASVGQKTKASGPSSEAIALRAYFVSEKRQREGLPGNSDSDWIEAERQLKQEAAAPAPRPKAGAADRKTPAPAAAKKTPAAKAKK